MNPRLQAVRQFSRYIKEQRDNEIAVPKPVIKYVKMALTKERFFDKEARK